MSPRRPPDILRKSHRHGTGKERAQDRRALRRELDEVGGDDDGGPGGASPAAAILIDLDGVVYEGERLVDGACEALERLEALGVARLFVTNTTSRPRDAIVEKLAALGVGVDAREILTPPIAAAEWLAGRVEGPVALFVPPATEAEFEGVVRAAPGARAAAVVVGDYGERWTFAELNRAFRLLMNEPRPVLIALGMTRYWRAPDGLRLDAGPFVAALTQASGIEPVVLGKPSAEFFGAALAALGVAAGDAVIVGDDIVTDVGAAQALGIRGILVRTGKFREADLASGIEPFAVVDSIADVPALWEAGR
jgi:HAD superfamily hydrolase (TIGR01458 family)